MAKNISKIEIFSDDYYTFIGERNAFFNDIGIGIEINKNGFIYGGDFKKGLKSGIGHCLYPDGNQYFGEWKNNKPDGIGRYEHIDGTYYEGELKKGESHGFGIIEYPNKTSYNPGGQKYVGEWKNGKRHGYGSIILPNGDEYQGEWKNDEVNGRGTFFFSNGDVCIGEWKDGEPHGYCQRIFAKEADEANEHYSGEWKDGKKHGIGTHTNTNGEQYKGRWKNDVRHGHGVCKFSNGDRYDGEWKNGEFFKGRFLFSDGSHYTGRWKNNLRHGQGIMVFNNNVRHEGKWKNGNEYDIKVYQENILSDIQWIKGKVGFKLIRSSLRYRSGDKQKSYRYKEELDSADIPEWKKQVIYEATPSSCSHFPSLLHLANRVEYIVQNNIPGDFVECGVYMGGSCMVIAGILKHYNLDRRILMYDTYDGVPLPNSNEVTCEGNNLQNWYKETQLDENGNSTWCYSSIDDVKYNMNSVGYNGEIQYIQGDVMNTLPDNISNSIALLRIDVDLYEPTRHVLEHLYKKLSNKGSLILDDYGYFPKVKETVDDFLQDRVSDLEEITYTVRHLIK